MLYSDRGGEYLNQVMEAYCASKGIIHYKSPPRTHEHHGRAENLNKRMNQGLRAMLFGYQNVPKDLFRLVCGMRQYV
jgi:hypothetical protein